MARQWDGPLRSAQAKVMDYHSIIIAKELNADGHLTTLHGGWSQPMVRSLFGTPSRSVSGLHSRPLPIKG